MRQYGEVPPWLNPGTAPQVASATGLGTGGGAGVVTADGTGFGEVWLQVGTNPTTAGNVVLAFAANPPSLFISGSEGLGALAVSGQQTKSVTVAWSGASLVPGSRVRIGYEWAVSK